MIIYCTRCGAGRPAKPGDHRYGEPATVDGCAACPEEDVPEVEIDDDLEDEDVDSEDE